MISVASAAPNEVHHATHHVPARALTPTPKQRLPVTLLSGFLGAGKTSLLKHVLEHKGELKCAVIVNDMAEINIDAALIKSARVVQAEQKVVEMQNGCICCTLREDLLEEVGKLAEDGRFDYLIIESTGISEPQQVAETFAMDLSELEGGQPGRIVSLSQGADANPVAKYTSLKDLAALDCCVTVVDASNLLAHLNSIKQVKDLPDGEKQEDDERTIAHLLIDQLEFANVILLNKTDLVCEKHRKSLEAFINTINPNATVISTTEGKVDLTKILNTGVFDMEQAEKSAGWLQSLMADTPHTPETEEYGISSFIYKARKPFHPQRLYDFLSLYFVVEEPEIDMHDHDHEGGDDDEEGEEMACIANSPADGAPTAGTDSADPTASDSEDTLARTELVKDIDMTQVQDESAVQRAALDPEEIAKRREALYGKFGHIFRAKGHLWLPGERNNLSGDLGLAGSICRITPDAPWFASLDKELWPPGLEDLPAFQADMDGNVGDRRQELVFIGQNMKKADITAALDHCLLKRDEEFSDPFRPWPKFEVNVEYCTDEEDEDQEVDEEINDSETETDGMEESQGREKMLKGAARA